MSEHRILASCGNDCSACPRYVKHPYEKTEEELLHTARLWMKIGYRDHVVKCCEEKGIQSCASCPEYPCGRMRECFAVTKSFEPKCREVCTVQEFDRLHRAFFEKEENLRH